METIKTLLIIIFVIAIVFLGYNLMSKYVIPRTKANKWVLLSLAIIILILNYGLKVKGTIYEYINIALFMILYFSFMDLFKSEKNDKAKTTISSSKTKRKTLK